MREIKFRGKTIEGNWVIGNLLQFDDGSYHIKADDSLCRYGCGEEVDSNTVGQYTGLKDKHENEVYEGDIISVNDKILKIVEYKEECASFTITNIEDLNTKAWQDPRHQFDECWWNDFKRDIKVVGNIYDNPELLKGGEE